MHEPLHNIISHQDKNSLDYREKALMEKLNSKAMHKFSFWYYRKSVFSTFFTNFHSLLWILLNLVNLLQRGTLPLPALALQIPNAIGIFLELFFTASVKEFVVNSNSLFFFFLLLQWHNLLACEIHLKTDAERRNLNQLTQWLSFHMHWALRAGSDF